MLQDPKPNHPWTLLDKKAVVNHRWDIWKENTEEPVVDLLDSGPSWCDCFLAPFSRDSRMEFKSIFCFLFWVLTEDFFLVLGSVVVV